LDLQAIDVSNRLNINSFMGLGISLFDLFLPPPS